jgi:carbamoyltransferase
VWVQPAAGDAGGALGVALLVWHQLLGKPRSVDPGGADRQRGSMLGPRYSTTEVMAALDEAGANYTVIHDEGELCRRTADLLAAGKVVGWFQGRMEFGPRALGSRSILGDPRDPRMQSNLNLKVKFRESFRPFAPSVLADHARDWFDLGRLDESPYMLFTAPVAAARRVEPDPAAAQAEGLARLGVARSVVPAVTHVDGTARIQTVDEARHGRYHRLLEAFNQATGCPVLVNTSFNVRGEPIVLTPADAYRCFLNTDIDVLVVEDALLVKEDQPGAADRRHEYLREFALD